MKGRITNKKFTDFVNSQLLKLGVIDYVATKTDRTRYTQDQYECGACKIHVHLERVDKTPMITPLFFMCFYSFSEYEKYKNNGYEMVLQFNGRLGILKDLTVELRKV